MKILLTTLIILFFISCTNADISTQILEDSGYSDIEITGYNAFSCSEDDFYSTGFIAKNIREKYIVGTVCCGILKDCTIRFNSK